MKETFSKEQRLLHQLVLHANDAPVRGLFDGQMGVVLALSEYVKDRRLRPLKTAVDFLLDQVIEHLSEDASLDFANGLMGIGWGVEYLLQQGFQQGSGAEICRAIDQKLMARNLFRMDDLSLETGLLGQLHYLAAHVQGACREGKAVFDAPYLKDCLMLCHHVQQHVSDAEVRQVALLLAGLLQGEPVAYTFRLRDFVLPEALKEKSKLGLRKGMAGHLLYCI